MNLLWFLPITLLYLSGWIYYFFGKFDEYSVFENVWLTINIALLIGASIACFIVGINKLSI